MDIRKLAPLPLASYQSKVNNGQARAAVAGRDWSAQQTLPPLSAMFPDPAYANAAGFHYPMPPHGEGFNSYQFAAYQQQHQQPAQVYASSQFTVPPPAPAPRQPEHPYISTNPTLRSSSSTVSVSSTKYAPSNGSAPATSAERRSLSDEDDDDESDEDISGGSTPLPPYNFSSQTSLSQGMSFLDAPLPSQTPSVDGVDYVCDDCGVSYSRAPDLRKHKASVHGDRDSREKVAATFPCDVCGQVLLSSHGYQGHMRRHYDERPFVCEAPYCGKAFHDSATLARHRRTHSTEHKFECDFCGRRFKRKDNLNTHRKKHQVGGESINPNLLRKPVARVQGSGPIDSPPQAPAYTESLALSAAPAYAPPYEPRAIAQMPQSYAPYPQPAPPYYQTQPQAVMYQQQQQRPTYMVKAEDMSAEFDFRRRMSGLAPATSR